MSWFYFSIFIFQLKCSAQVTHSYNKLKEDHKSMFSVPSDQLSKTQKEWTIIGQNIL